MISALCDSFKVEIFLALHNFASDAFFMALYDDAATIGLATTNYVTAGEISGPGYAAGGQQLTGPQILGPVNSTAYVTFNDPVWTNSSLTARGALIYNQTKQQRAVATLDFGAEFVSNNGNFRVKFPPPGQTTALIRLM